MCLNIPIEFYRRPIEKPFVERIPVLPSGECSDMEYVLFRQRTFYKDVLSKQDETCCHDREHYPPQEKIEPPLIKGQLYMQQSYSTLSINPSMISEEIWQSKQNFLPLGLYCCGNRNLCTHSQSREQIAVNVDIPKNINPLNDERFMYITTVPKISPLRSCWKLLLCKRKVNQDEPYMPTVMTKHFQRGCAICPQLSNKEKKELKMKCTSNNVPYISSKLSTIAESELSISEYSYTKFNSFDRQHCKSNNNHYSFVHRKLKPNKHSLHKDSTTNYDSNHFYNWICHPCDSNHLNKFNAKSQQKYVCYNRMY